MVRSAVSSTTKIPKPANWKKSKQPGAKLRPWRGAIPAPEPQGVSQEPGAKAQGCQGLGAQRPRGPRTLVAFPGKGHHPRVGTCGSNKCGAGTDIRKRHLKGCYGRNYSRRDFSPLSAALEPGTGAPGMQFLCWSLLPFCSSKPAPGRNFCFILSGISEASEF